MVRLWRALGWRFLIGALLCCLASAAGAGERPRVIFVNPGKPDEPFWPMLAAVMKAAASQLDMSLDIEWALRDRIAMVDLGVQAARARPDYLVLVNEQRSAWAGFEEAAKLGVKVLLLNNPFSGTDLARFGGPRERFANYIGALLPDNVAAGRAMALALAKAAIARGDSDPLELLAINGLSATPAAADRFAGLQQALAEEPRLRLVAHTEVEWSRAAAADAVEGLLLRHKGLQLVWAASDVMGLGAIDAAVRAGIAGDRRWLVTGLNWSPDGLAAIRDGRMLMAVGGHFMAGGFALVMLRDYHDGRDFAEVGATQHMPFAVLDRSNVDAYVARYGGGNWGQIDFTALRRRTGDPGYRFDPAVLTRR
ncbi:MAG: ABC transporter substrate-binding protein [Ferrovibrionaceae bacterium]